MGSCIWTRVNVVVLLYLYRNCPRCLYPTNPLLDCELLRRVENNQINACDEFSASNNFASDGWCGTPHLVEARPASAALELVLAGVSWQPTNSAAVYATPLVVVLVVVYCSSCEGRLRTSTDYVPLDYAQPLLLLARRQIAENHGKDVAVLVLGHRLCRTRIVNNECTVLLLSREYSQYTCGVL